MHSVSKTSSNLYYYLWKLYVNSLLLTVYADEKVICTANPDTVEVSWEVKLDNVSVQKFIRVEVEGNQKEKVMVSTPFFIK